jgi:hypothetical protein
LEGYAGRNRETELAFLGFGNARPPSRFSSEIGTKADAKQQLEGFCAPVRFYPAQSQSSPMSLRAADEIGMQQGFERKEFWFAYF